MASTSAAPDTGAPDSIAWKLLVFIGVFIPIQVIVVGLRVYVRRFLTRSPLGWDDYICNCALACQMVAAGIAIGAAKQAGVGIHQAWLEENSPATLVVWGKYLTATATWYLITVNIPKLAILALYLRLFPQREIRIVIWITVVVMCCASLSTTIASLAACEPFEANFNPMLPGARCIDKEALFIWSSIPNIITDVVLLILPIPVVWKLNLNKNLRAGLVATFLLGSLGLITSVLRFRTFFTTNSFTDGTYNAVELIIWTNVEPGIYLICACLPVYKTLVDRWTRREGGTRPSHMENSKYANYGRHSLKTTEDQTEDNDSQTELRSMPKELDPVAEEPANRIKVSTVIHSEWSD